MRKPLFSVTIKDCRVDTFTVGGNGGGGKDTSNTGVRVTHPPSGASARATETRSQLANKRTAFVRMANSEQFQLWAKIEAARLSNKETIQSRVDHMMQPENIRVEFHTKDGWLQEIR